MKRFIPLIITALIALNSCKQSESTRETKISSSGKSSELLVVANEGVWKSQVGDSVFKFFTQDMPGLNTSEPLFDVVQIPHASLNKMFQSHRNILMLELENQLDSAVVEIRENVWSQPQVVIRIRFPERDEFYKAFSKHSALMLRFYNETEIKRIQKAFSNVEEVKIRSAIRNHLGFSMIFPRGFYVAKEDEDFMWIRQITNDYNMEVMLHVFSYNDTSVFSPEHVIKLRDELGIKFIPGPLDSTWMGTEQLLSPDVRRMKFNDMYAAETRGLWKVMNHSGMGGPYLNYCIHDSKNDRIIFVDGFVYYPSKDKRDLMRQMEGIFRSLKVN